MPKLTNNEITELVYMQSMDFDQLRYDKYLSCWTCINKVENLGVCRMYNNFQSLDKRRTYTIIDLLNEQDKKLVFVPRVVN